MTDSKCNLTWSGSAPAVINNGSLCRKAKAAAQNTGLKNADILPAMISDDFSFFTENAPGAYIKIGTGKGKPLHHPAFRVDPDAIEPTAKFLTELLYASLTE